MIFRLKQAKGFAKIAFVLWFSSTAAIASYIPAIPCFNAAKMRVVASVGAGYLTTNVGESQTFPIVNPITDEFFIYTATDQRQSRAFYEGFLGIEQPIDPQYAVQIGLAYQQQANFRSQGNLVQGADVPSSDQFTYSFDVRTRQLLLETKLLYEPVKYYHLYALLGLGFAYNKAQNFTTSVPPFLTFTREYSDNNETSFAYTAGFGLDADLWDDLRIGVGYRYASIGNAKLGQATIDGVKVGGTLSVGRINTHQVIAQLTVLFM